MKCLKTHYLSNVILKQLNNLEYIIFEPITPTLFTASKKRKDSAFTFMYTKLSPFIIIICINKDNIYNIIYTYKQLFSLYLTYVIETAVKSYRKILIYADLIILWEWRSNGCT